MAATPIGKVKVTVNMSADLHHLLKMEAAVRKTNMCKLLEEALKKYAIDPSQFALGGRR